MLRTIILFTLFQLLAILTAFSQYATNNTTKKPFKYILFYSPSDIYITFNKNYKPNTLTQKQFVNVKSIIERVSDSLNFFNTSTNIRTGKIDTLKYVFQIVSAKDNKGHNIVWVNAICNPSKNWNKRLMVVEDGGSCYYNFKISLDRLKYFDLLINGSS